MDLKISVIIPTYRDWETLSECLKYLQNQTLSSTQFEVVIVNNEPSDLMPQDFELPPNTRVITESKPGSYAARNKGVNETTSDFLAFTDSDCAPAPNWLENGVNLLLQFDMVGGRMEFFKPSDASDLAFIYEKKFGFNQKRNVEEKGQSVTANLFCKREVFTRIGPFSENLLSGGDFEWTKRATSSGFKMAYGEQVVVSHPSRKNIAELIRKKKRTIGGMYTRFYNSYTPKQKVFFALHFIRPHVSIFTYSDLSAIEKIKLFFATWYVECIGMKEMLKLDLGIKKAERV
ncbi:glycosyltransferase [Algoriphagus yeomjeoni]|uniref:Glycosyl transferase family 2 n=1 Tax=Algoriphagus yeomjeoni TaxID=291403 RepID=A0A327PIH5_9BACT|nr:glycosyltransferase [Algoriphagus yeomjeoni]RAI89506.1 glycosyl transferase family 2 [Algoriphagus yeomjeoni]